MGLLMQRFLRKLVFLVIGAGLWLVWHSFSGAGGGGATELDRMPAAVLGGGGGVMEFDIDMNQPGVLSATFESNDYDAERDDGDPPVVSVYQKLAAGHHTFEVDVADDTYGYVELDVPGARVGTQLDWSVILDGRTIAAESMTLEEPLEEGYAFFVNLEFDDIDGARSYTPVD